MFHFTILLRSIKYFTELLKIREPNIRSLSKISKITKELNKKGQVDPGKTNKKKRSLERLRTPPVGLEPTTS